MKTTTRRSPQHLALAFALALGLSAVAPDRAHAQGMLTFSGGSSGQLSLTLNAPVT